MVGDGPEYSSVHHRARTLGVLDKTEFVGKQANIADYLGVADVSLLPSDLESFGLAALEAQACEVPVIASRVGTAMPSEVCPITGPVSVGAHGAACSAWL